MPRTRKPKQVKPPDDANLNTGADAPEAQEADAGGENRPSQLDQMRAALMDAPHREEPAEDFPEVPQPEEEAEPPAHIDEPAAAAAEPEAQATSETTAPPTADSDSIEATAPSTSAWVPPPAYPPPAPAAAQAARSGGSSSGLAVGLVLVVVGIFFLIMRLFEIDLSSYGWPLYVIIPGLTLLIIGFVIFESIFNISGQDFGIVSRAALPVLLIIIGVTLLARSVQRGRSA